MNPEIDEKRYRRYGLVLIAVLIAVFGVWAALAPLESAVSAPGKVSVASNNRIVQHLEGGIVKAILVRDGDTVKKGQTLVELDTTRSESELKIALSQYVETLAEEARLRAEQSAHVSIDFSEELKELCLQENCSETLQTQRDAFDARRRYNENEKEILQRKIDQLREQSEGLRQSIEANRKLSQSYAQEIKEWKVLFEEQLTDKLHLREIERQKIRTDGDIANDSAQITRIQSQIAETQAQILQSKQSFNKEVSEKLTVNQAKISDLRSRITALKDTLQRTTIISPVEGTVTNLQIHTIGGVIPSAKPILEIVPSGEQLIIEGKVAATEIGYVHTGLRSEIRFPGFSHIKTLDIVEGEVTHIAADAVSDETTHILYYPVKITVTNEGMEELSKNHLQLQPGIPADAMIVTGSRTVLDYLIHPFKMMLTKSFNEQ